MSGKIRSRVIIELARLLSRPDAAREIAAIGDTFSRNVRVAMGPDLLFQSAWDRYIEGGSAADFERDVDRILREFPKWTIPDE